MNKIWKATRYLAQSTLPFVVVGFLSMLGNLAVTDTISYFARRNGELDRQFSNHTEFTAGVFILLIGLLFFGFQFRVLLGHGVSRRSFFWANLASMAAISAVFALFVTLVTLAHLPFVPMQLISQRLYGGASLLDSAFFQAALYFMLAILGWLVHLAYFRSNVLLRWIISLAPFALVWAIISSGRRSGFLWEAMVAMAGMANDAAPNPYIAVLSMLGLSALMGGVVYLLLRRAPLKE